MRESIRMLFELRVGERFGSADESDRIRVPIDALLEELIEVAGTRQKFRQALAWRCLIGYRNWGVCYRIVHLIWSGKNKIILVKRLLISFYIYRSNCAGAERG
jgi:hypothetical protein